jgi:hypothetical protein
MLGGYFGNFGEQYTFKVSESKKNLIQLRLSEIAQYTVSIRPIPATLLWYNRECAQIPAKPLIALYL